MKESAELGSLRKIKNEIKNRYVIEYENHEKAHRLIAYNNIYNDSNDYEGGIQSMNILFLTFYRLAFQDSFYEKKVFFNERENEAPKTGIFIFEKDFSRLYTKIGKTGNIDEITKQHKELYAESTDREIVTGEEFQNCLRGFTQFKQFNNGEYKMYLVVSAYLIEHRDDLVDRILDAFSGVDEIVDANKYCIFLLGTHIYSHYNDSEGIPEGLREQEIKFG